MTRVDQILDLFSRCGESQYGGEAVSQLEHALQAAFLAEREHAGPALIAAALLHDVGHLLHNLPDDAPNHGIDDFHENSAASYLRGLFPDEVIEPVRLHVAAKRYLCAVEAGYMDLLSEPSMVSLKLQGGPMADDEVVAFRQNPHFDAAVRLRRWDDAAKDPNLRTPVLGHFASYMRDVSNESQGT